MIVIRHSQLSMVNSIFVGSKSVDPLKITLKLAGMKYWTHWLILKTGRKRL